MLDDFLVRAMLGGVGVALVAGPLGCVVVWRRMAYFGGALAHSALLGVALGLLLAIDIRLATLAICVLFALLLGRLQRRRELATDTLLGVFAETSLALGLVALSFMETVRIDLMAYLFGDVLAIGRGDLLWIWAGGLAVLAALAALWEPLLRITLHAELAQAEGLAVEPVRYAFMLLIALTVAMAMKIVGILLIVALLIIPAAAARPFARNPEQMALATAALGALAVALGIFGSLTFDTPSGPSIVVAMASLFGLSLCLGGLRLMGRRVG